MTEAALRSMLLADAAVSGLVGTRIYAGRLPQSHEYPAVTIDPVTEDDNNTLNSVGGLRWMRIEINAWALTYAEVNTLHKAVNTALNGSKGLFNGIDIRSVTSMSGGRYFYEDSVEAHRRLRDYSVWYRA